MLTFGPGDHPFFKFGHNALWVKPRDEPGQIFNFGTFSFDQPNLIAKFLRGRLIYWLSVGPAAGTLYGYEASNRTILAQELDLTPAESRALAERLADNLRPEKREYLYDYFLDNCSTRVRDAVDAVLRGQVRAAGRAPAAMTLRDHALRMTSDLLWEYTALHFGLGPLTDRPLDAWGEAFLPEKLRDLLRTVHVAREGGARPLVRSERVLFQARRAPPAARPPAWWPWFALLGLGSGAVLAALGWLGRRRAGARVALGVLAGLLGLVLGLLGLILMAVWIFTNHRAAHGNANILLCAPWAVALLPLGVGVALGWVGAQRAASWVALVAVVSALVGAAAKLLPGPAQNNTAFLLLLVPLWIGLAAGLRQLLPAPSRH
jgi:hypothetical protein